MRVVQRERRVVAALDDVDRDLLVPTPGADAHDTTQRCSARTTKFSRRRCAIKISEPELQIYILKRVGVRSQRKLSNIYTITIFVFCFRPDVA